MTAFFLVLSLSFILVCGAGPAFSQNPAAPDFSFTFDSTGRASANASSEQILYGFDREFPPFSFEDARGRPTGFEVELVRAIAAQTGLNIVYRPLEWSRIQPELSVGSIQMTTGLVKTQRRSIVFLFSDKPYFSAGLRIFVRQPDYVRDLSRLRGRIIGVEENSFAGEILREYPGLGMQPFTDKVSGLQSLYQQQIAGYLGIGPNVDWLLDQLRYTDIIPAGPPLRKLELWFATAPGTQALMDKLQKGYDAVVRNGQYDQLYRSWFVEELTREERDQLVAEAYNILPMAYAPHSKQPSAAAVLCRGGILYAAASVEHENKQHSISAVQAAVSRALTAGELEIRAIALVDAAGNVVVPPETDLDFLAEFGRGILIALPPVNRETAENTLTELRPQPPVR